MIRSIYITSLITILSIITSTSYAEELNHLPGYKFNYKEIEFLKDYKVKKNRIYYESIDSLGIKQQLLLEKNNSKILINIHIAQDQKINTNKIMSNIVNNPMLTTAFTYNKQNHKIVGVGETLYTNQTKVKDTISIRLLFSRNNIVVEISDETIKPTTNLKSIAQQIDKNIDNQTKVTFKEIASHKPIIEKFNLDKDQLKEFTENKLTIQISDPSKLKTFVFFESNGEVTKNNSNYIFDSSSASPKETLTIIVVNDHLLYSKKTIEFTVIK